MKEPTVLKNPSVLTINGGSSSIKFSVFELINDSLQRGLVGKIERIGVSGTNLTVNSPSADQTCRVEVDGSSYASAIDFLIQWFESQAEFASIQGIGHRIVHGMQHSEPELVTPDLLTELVRISPYAPRHLPGEINLINAFRTRHPRLPQVCCFDTAFHRSMPRVARLLAIPRRYESQGVERYGFHGLSYAYLMEELQRIGDPAAAQGRVILAHLGNGSSMAAVRDGKCIDTSMGFTPTAGLPMSTRSGDLDPGLLSYLSQTENMTPAQFDQMVNGDSGLLGISETSSDVRDLLAMEATDARAAEALALYCYQAKKWIGSFTAALGGLDTLVFAGGIGENAPVIRSRICDGLQFLGIALDQVTNSQNSQRISALDARVTVRVIPTDEELTIAKSVRSFLNSR